MTDRDDDIRSLWQDLPAREKYVARRNVVGDSVDPCSEGASVAEVVKASPQREVNILLEIGAPVGVSLIRAREPLNRRSILGDGAFIELVLARGLGRWGRHR